MITRFLPKVTMASIDSLHRAGFNPPGRVENERKIRELMDGIKELGGIAVPLLVTNDMVIIDGHRRHEAARRLKMPEVPVIVMPLSLQQGWRVINTTSETIAPKDWVQTYLLEMATVNIPTRQRRQIETIEKLCGRDLLVLIADRGLSPNVLEEAKRLARYVLGQSSREQPEEKTWANCLRWLVEQQQQAAARRALKAEMSPRVLFFAIETGQPLEGKKHPHGS